MATANPNVDNRHAPRQRGRPPKPQVAQRPLTLGPVRPSPLLDSNVQKGLPSSSKHGGSPCPPHTAQATATLLMPFKAHSSHGGPTPDAKRAEAPEASDRKKCGKARSKQGKTRRERTNASAFHVGGGAVADETWRAGVSERAAWAGQRSAVCTHVPSRVGARQGSQLGQTDALWVTTLWSRQLSHDLSQRNRGEHTA